jgi:hypothetical protein
MRAGRLGVQVSRTFLSSWLGHFSSASVQKWLKDRRSRNRGFLAGREALPQRAALQCRRGIFGP